MIFRDMLTNPGKYSKLWAALGAVFVEAVSLWAGAPSWVVALAGLVGSWVVYRVPNQT